MPYPGTGRDFSLCLTHDVDRPYKTYQAVFDAVTNRSLDTLRPLYTDENPYWQFEDIMAIEDSLGVRSGFYFLNERHLFSTSPRNWLSPIDWIQHLGRYDVTADEIVSVIRALEAGDWEIGLHGSFHSCDDPERLRVEKATLESVIDGPVRGGRQHYLRLNRSDTWRHHRSLGLDYDLSLGRSTSYGFSYGYGVHRPFEDDFVVFPLTVMDQALPNPGTHFEQAWSECEQLLEEAAEHDAIMTVLWHVRLFNSDEFPGYRRLYRRLVERAIELGAWVGAPRELYDRMRPDWGSEPVRPASDADVDVTGAPSAVPAIQGGAQ